MCGTKGERHFISSSNTLQKGFKDLPGISLATSTTKETSRVAFGSLFSGQYFPFHLLFSNQWKIRSG